MAEYEWMKQVHDMLGRKTGAVYAWDRVNEAMIRQWCEVMGVDNPLYTDPDYARQSEYGGIVAPPGMLQAWCLAGFKDELPPGSSTENPFEPLTIMEAHGYPSVVAVNSEMSFDRYVRVGERLYYTSVFDSVSEEKTTGLGTGFFVTVIMYFYSQAESGADEKVGELLFRVFKFKAPAQSGGGEAKQDDGGEDKKITRMMPGISDDTRFFWDGLKQGKLLIQHCKTCDKLQHPPGPVCMHCQSFDLDSVESSGTGTLYSYVVMHYPEVPPYEYPNPIGLVELDEGTRIIAGLVDCDSEKVAIGQRLELVIQTFDGDLTLPQFRPVAG